jgi:hypothetical protein
MRTYTFYTDSHREIFEIFEKNFPYDANSQLNVKWFPQECQTGSYMTDGWNSTMKRKVEYILEALNETKENNWFVHCDCDILLFKGWTDILNKQHSNTDIMIQSDATELCAGFFFCKSNNITKTLWTHILENINSFTNDQTALNYYVHNLKGLKTGILPNTYFTYGMLKGLRWDGKDFTIPNIDKLKMFHANWTTGINNKKELLKICLEQKNGN